MRRRLTHWPCIRICTDAERTGAIAALNGGGVRDDCCVAGLLPSDDRTPQPWPVLVNP